eukprot:PhM_4_TR13903/c2_g1_i5/m.96169
MVVYIPFLSSWWKFAYGNCLCEFDTFPDRMRKLFVSVGLHITPLAFFSIINGAFNVFYGNNLSLLHYLPVAIPMFITAVVAIFTWNKMRTTHSANANAVGPIMILLMATMFGILLQNPMTSYNCVYLGAMLAAIVCRAHDRLVVIGYTLMCVLTAYNLFVNGGDGGLGMGYVIGIRNDYDDKPMIGRLDDQVMILGFVWFSLSIVAMQTTEYETMIAKASLAHTTASHVGVQLLRYDISGARILLSEYKSNRAHDRNMHSVLSEIVKNMELYRPFLPNYLIEDNNMNNSSINTSNSDSDAAADTSLCMSAVVASPVGGEPSRANQLQAVTIPDNNTNITDDDYDDELGTPSSSTSREDEGTRQHIQKATPVIRTRNALLGTAAIKAMCAGIINFAPFVRRLQCNSDGGADDHITCLPIALSDLVEHVRISADEYLGTIHSFFGDVLFISWNTARNAPHPETVALLFLEACRTYRRENRLQLSQSCSFSCSSCVGALYSGDARFLLCGKRLFVPWIRAAWLPQLQQMTLTYCNDTNPLLLGTNVANGSTIEAARRLLRSKIMLTSLRVRRFDFLLSTSTNNNNNNNNNN